MLIDKVALVERGNRCPKCRSTSYLTIKMESRDSKGSFIDIRKCACGQFWTTKKYADAIPLSVTLIRTPDYKAPTKTKSGKKNVTNKESTEKKQLSAEHQNKEKEKIQIYYHGTSKNGKYTWRIFFLRNELSFDNFDKVEEGWLYKESFVYHGTKCEVKILVKLKDLSDIWNIRSKKVKIQGTPDNLSISMYLSDQKVPFLTNGISGDKINYVLKCTGNNLSRYTGKRSIKEYSPTLLSHSTSKKKVKIPTSVSWSAAHPYQGGGF